MTHRSPLVTLAGLVVAFAIMFGVNMAMDRDQPAPAGVASASASPAPTTQAPRPSASESASASSSPRITQTPAAEQFPDKTVYAGRTKDGTTALAVAVLKGQAAAYVCDGRSVESWLRGAAKDGELKLQVKNGDQLEAKLRGSVLTGSIEIRHHKHSFAIKEAKKPAGLYRAKGSKTTIGWIVLENGSQVGIERDQNGSSKAAPKLDPDQPSVTANGEDLTAEPVEGNQDV